MIYSSKSNHSNISKLRSGIKINYIIVSGTKA